MKLVLCWNPHMTGSSCQQMASWHCWTHAASTAHCFWKLDTRSQHLTASAPPVACMIKGLGVSNTVVVASATATVFFPYLPIPLPLTKLQDFFHVSRACHQPHLPRTQKRAGGGLLFTFRQRVANATSLARKSEPEVAFFSRFDNVLPTPPPSHAKASRRWPSFHVSTTCRQCHLPRTQKRAGGGLLFTFRQHVANATSLACKSEPKVVFFSRFNCISSPPTSSHATVSRRWVFFLFRPYFTTTNNTSARHVIAYTDHSRTPNTTQDHPRCHVTDTAQDRQREG
jgi:hypothetical protein